MLTDDVEREIVVPREAVEPNTAVATPPATLALVALEPTRAAVAEAVPLAEELGEVRADVGLELEHALLREDVRDDLALAGMLGAGARVEEAALDGDERIIEVNDVIKFQDIEEWFLSNAYVLKKELENSQSKLEPHCIHLQGYHPLTTIYHIIFK